MPRVFRAALAVLSLVAALGLPTIAHASSPTKVAIIVGPVGSLTPTYLALADAAARAAEQHGAVVARAYSPAATAANVLAAVADAHIVIYFGHGYGHPSPYGGLNSARQNGWGLQGPRAHGTHGDGVNGELQYFGEDWIVANARPAPGFVMLYSNTCYAPGASEPGHAAPSPRDAALRVAHYSRKVFAMGGSAYLATDFDRGAADLVTRLLGSPASSFGSAFQSDHRFIPSALTAQAHPFAAGQSIWLHRSKYTDGPPNYWYAFAGNPDATPLRSWDQTAPTAELMSPEVNGTDVALGVAPTVKFSEPVTGVSAETLTLRDATNALVPATVAYDPASRVATVKPQASLSLGGYYSVAVGKGIVDKAARGVAPIAWHFATPLDSDALAAPLPIVLEAGTHRLVRFAADGLVADEQTLDVADRRSLAADRRARIPSQQGSWLRIRDEAHAGWWVSESPRAHPFGHVDDDLLAAGTTVELPAGEHIARGFDGNVPAADQGMRVTGGEVVAVDRRRVFDGRSFVRLAGGSLAGAWVEIAAGAGPTESSARPSIVQAPRGAVARVVLDAGDRPAFRFDEAGRVIGRRTVADAHTLGLTTDATLVIGGHGFLRIASGDLAGWTMAESPSVQVVPLVQGADAAG